MAGSTCAGAGAELCKVMDGEPGVRLSFHGPIHRPEETQPQLKQFSC